MQCERLIHTTINGSDKLFTTANFSTILNEKSKRDVNALGSHYLPEDLSYALTSIIPDVEESTGRMFNKSDIIVAKFTAEEIIKFLTQQELTALLQRIIAQTNLQNRIVSYQCKNGFELKNPLPDVTL